MTHTACQEMQDGKNVGWMEKVSPTRNISRHLSKPNAKAVK
jgi:hypothetical protein